jgi:hypothetical protein
MLCKKTDLALMNARRSKAAIAKLSRSVAHRKRVLLKAID